VLPALRAEAAGEAWGLSPKLGATLGLGEHVELKGNVGRSFRPPSFGELYLEQGVLAANANLRPETAGFVDLGLASRALPVSASVSGFYTLYDDLILYEYYPPMRARPYNFGKAEVYGAEAEASTSLGRLAISAAYTLSFSANRSGDERFFDKELPYHPRHRAHARASYAWWRLSAHADLDAQTFQQTNRTNTDPIPGRARADAGISARLLDAPGLWLDAEMRNLFDQQDQDLYGYPLEGRSFFLTLRADAPFQPTGAPHE
jgi:iron complex outermembrane receptor protein